MKKNNLRLDREESDLIASLERGEWAPDFDRTVKKKYEEYAKTSLSKHRRINIRMSDRDLRKIRVKALQQGIPYQSLISMLIHKFNEGKIVLK
jgi:predicted DNA binding CopG/RHH family protein